MAPSGLEAASIRAGRDDALSTPVVEAPVGKTPLGITSWYREKDATPLADHMNKLFQPLQFSTELAQRVLTHGSHAASVTHGSNAALNFAGE